MTFPNIQRLINCPYSNNIKQTVKCLLFAVMSPLMPKSNLHPWFFNQGKRCCQWPSVLCEPICSKRASAKNITVVSPALYIQQTANKILSQMINGTSPKGHLQDDVRHDSSSDGVSLLVLHAQAGLLFQKEFLWGLSLIEGLPTSADLVLSDVSW